MISDYEKIKVLENEREGIRSEKREIEKALYAAFFGMITAGALVAGVLINVIRVEDGLNKGGIFFVISQVEFLFIIFGLSCLSFMNVISGYLRCVEEKINVIAGTDISLWESRVTRKFFSGNSAFSYSMIVLTITFGFIFIATFLTSIIFLWNSSKVLFTIPVSVWALFWLPIEFLVASYLTNRANQELQKSYTFCKSIE